MKRHRVFLVTLLIFLQSSCKEKSLVLIKDEIISSNIDTIEFESRKDIYIFRAKENRPLGRFDYLYYLKKVLKNNKAITYRIDDNWPIVSNQYISKINNHTTNDGWFFVSKGKFNDNLPHLNEILDSLKSNNREYFITERKGLILFYQKGTLEKTYNYGSFVTKHRDSRYFENLRYKLYKVVGDSLVAVSNNPDKLLTENEGVYFIPKPGYGVAFNYDKQKIFDSIDSISKLDYYPSKLSFPPNRPVDDY
ncbi:MAG: hypothetical protein U0T68_01890 [Ferruginibacter sp.]